MPRPNTVVNRFRYTILAILVIVTVAYGYYLYRLYMPAQPPAAPPSIPVVVLADGSVRIEGVTYASPDTLQPKITALQKDHPGAGFSINAPRGEDFNGIAKAVVLMQRAGAKTVWVINEPKSDGEAQTKTGVLTVPRPVDDKK